MDGIHKFLMLAAVALWLGGCSNAASRAITFSPSSKDSLVAFELGNNIRKPISLTIALFDRATNRVTANSFVGQYFVEHDGISPPRHYVVRLPAGSYVVKDFTIREYNRITQVCLGEGTIAFDVSPGQQLYLGDFVVTESGISSNGSNLAKAQEAMRDYPKVQGELAQAEPMKVTFGDSTRLGLKICGG